jgi:hypothetical protein
MIVARMENLRFTLNMNQTIRMIPIRIRRVEGTRNPPRRKTETEGIPADRAVVVAMMMMEAAVEAAAEVAVAEEALEAVEEEVHQILPVPTLKTTETSSQAKLGIEASFPSLGISPLRRDAQTFTKS